MRRVAPIAAAVIALALAPRVQGGGRSGALRVVSPPERGEPAPSALCNDCATAQPLPAPTPTCAIVTGETTAACPSDFYVVDLVAGSFYSIGFCRVPCGGSASFDTMIRILDPTGCVVNAGNDDACGAQAQMLWQVSTGGPHVIEVLGWGGAFGTYSLALSEVLGAPCGSCVHPLATLVPTTTCQHVSGNTIACANDTSAATTRAGAWYSVVMLGGRGYTFTTCASSPSTCPGVATFDTRLDLWNSSCTTLLAASDDAIGCVNPRSSRLTFTPPYSGAFKLQVRGFEVDSGAFRLSYRQE